MIYVLQLILTAEILPSIAKMIRFTGLLTVLWYIINVDSSSAHTTYIKQMATTRNQVSIYPNPSNGSFIIELNSTTKQTLQIFDVNGKLVLSQIINGKTSINASSLNEGVYNLTLIEDNGIINKRLVIVR